MKRCSLKKIYLGIKEEIEKRLQEFRDNKDLSPELFFCLLTPQSRAKICWDAVLNLKRKGLLFYGCESEIRDNLNGVRFKNKKARYICEARGKLDKISNYLRTSSSPEVARDWLVRNIKGIGYKEASHFLRNIGFGRNLAILDRHILKNLKLYKVISNIPKTMTRRRYLQIEEKMRLFSKKIGIPMDALDLVLWYKETGEIFK